MGFSGLDILGTIAQVVVEAWDSSNRKKIEIEKLKNERTETLVKGGAIVAGIAATAFVAKKLIDKSDNIKINTPNVSIEAQSKNALPNKTEDSLLIDYDTVWFDRKQNQLGADLINQKDDSIDKVIYQIKGIGGKAYQIYESINNSDWKNIGIIDWAKMSISDLGKPENGGPIFAEIAKTAFRRPQKQIQY